MKKKKIGVITFWESNTNYGQVLQCYALQHFLRSQGYDVILIRQYVWYQHVSKKGIKRVKQWIKDILAGILYYTNLANNSKIAERFAFCFEKESIRRLFPSFRMHNLRMSKIYATSEALVANPPQADVYITGSDQVWNYSLIPGEIKTFFLQFGNEKAVRVAYAASIGHSDFSEEIKTTIKTYLSSFSSISVRESSAVNVLKNLGFEATPVLDPTMLLTAKDYQKFLGNNSHRKHIFIYSMNYETINDIPFDEIKKYAQDKDLPIIVTPGDGFVSARELFEGVEYCYATIPQWIQLITNAQLVVTASFHGIVFSILMHTPFIYTPLRGEYAESNNRVLDLLKNLDLEQQIYTKQFNPHINIEWDYVDEKLDLLRQRSSEYLLNSIKK